MAERAKVGVVTVTYNSADVINPFLASLLQQTYSNFIAYLVDNASSDNTLDLVRKEQDRRLQTIQSVKNIGVAAGNNLGINAALKAGCEYVVLLNNDTEFSENLLEELVAGITRHNCDMTTAKIVYFDQPTRIWSAGGTFLPWAANRSKHYGLDELDTGQFETARSVQYTPTCCLLAHRRVFERLGLMDEKYFVYVDDTDFLFRAMRGGFVLYYLPTAIVKHKIGFLTGGGESVFSIRFSTRNKVYFIRKHYSPAKALFWLMLYQLHLMKRLLGRKDSVGGWTLRQTAFREGFHVNLTKPEAAEQAKKSFDIISQAR